MYLFTNHLMIRYASCLSNYRVWSPEISTRFRCLRVELKKSFGVGIKKKKNRIVFKTYTLRCMTARSIFKIHVSKRSCIVSGNHYAIHHAVVSKRIHKRVGMVRVCSLPPTVKRNQKLFTTIETIARKNNIRKTVGPSTP